MGSISELKKNCRFKKKDVILRIFLALCVMRRERCRKSITCRKEGKVRQVCGKGSRQVCRKVVE